MPIDAPDDRAGTRRGLDGLTSEELAASRRGWWDDFFTAQILRAIPEDACLLVDVGSGIGTAAHGLMPVLTRTKYLGIDADGERARTADAALRSTPYATRAWCLAARAEQLPCADRTADVELTSMTLQHVDSVDPVVQEIKRVLKTDGRIIAVEPDNLSNTFYFDGPLEDVNAAFVRLFRQQRHARRPADIAIGPMVPRLFDRAGFRVIACRPCALGVIRAMRADDLKERATTVANLASASHDRTLDHVRDECLAAIDRSIRSSGEIGYGGQVAVVFVTVGQKG